MKLTGPSVSTSDDAGALDPGRAASSFDFAQDEGRGLDLDWEKESESFSHSGSFAPAANETGK
jgi:hypothetical protein